MAFGAEIKKELKKRHMTVKELEGLTGISCQALYSMIRRDSNHIDVDALKKIRDALDLNETQERLDKRASIGKNIKAYREKRGLSLRALSDLITPKMSAQQISQYENGRCTPKMDTLKKIADALNTSIGELVPDDMYTSEKYFSGVNAYLNLMPEYVLHINEQTSSYWLNYPDGSVSKDISITDLQNVIQDSVDYLRFKLERFRR